MNRTDRRYVVTLAVVAAAILIVGYWLRPAQPTADDRVPAPSQTELSRLNRITQRRSLDDMTAYFATIAEDVQGSVVAIPSLERSGLMWEPGVVLTARTESRFPLATTVSTPDGDLGVAAVDYGPQTPIATVRMSDVQGLAPPRRRPAASVEPGTWMVGVWRRLRETNFVPAHFLDIARVQCGDRELDELRSNVAWTLDMAGGGLFDLDANLIGAVLPCGDRFAAITADSIDALLTESRSVEGRLLGRYGIRFDALTENERWHFDRGESVIIREVWSGYLADAAGLAPGDILIAINAEPIGVLDQLAPLADAIDVDTFDVAVLRDSEVTLLVLPADPAVLTAAPPAGEESGIVWEPDPMGYLIDAVVSDSPAALAGIRGGDRLLRINGNEPEDLSEVREALASERDAPVFLEVDRGGRRWGVLLP